MTEEQGAALRSHAWDGRGHTKRFGFADRRNEEEMAHALRHLVSMIRMRALRRRATTRDQSLGVWNWSRVARGGLGGREGSRDLGLPSSRL
jgi:hypothetical protein